MDKNLAISKLIILTIVKQIPSITCGQLINLALETLYMDYFTYIQAFSELQRDHMLLKSARKDEVNTDASGKPLERCDITKQGETVLKTLDSKIPLHVKTYLLQSTASRKKDIRKNHDIRAEYEPDANGHYTVTLSQHDGIHELINLKLSIPEKQMASQICQHWKNQPGSTYVSLLALLTGENKILADHNFPSPSDECEDLQQNSQPAKPYKQEQRLI